ILREMASPIPRLPPVTRTLCIVPGQLSGCGNIERADEPDHSGDLVGRQRRPAIGQDLIADLTAPTGVAAFNQNDIGDHDAAGDRAASRFGARHAYFRMPIDDGFYFFRMNLEAADIDDAAAPSDEMVSVSTQFDHVAGIDEPLSVDQRRCVWTDISTCGSRRTNPERSVLDFHNDTITVLPDDGCGETFQAVIDRETNAGLGRRVGMANRSSGKGPAQAVEHGLVGDLARQADVPGREPCDRSAHQQFAPVRWRARYLSDPRCIQPFDVFRNRFTRLRQNHRAAADDGAQEYLKATVAAN